MNEITAKPGDWVCFYRGGRIVYAKVEYIAPREVYPSRQVLTTEGAVSHGSIIERREGPHHE